jgi:hypothetical protein
MGAPRRIEQMYAWLTLDPKDNTEGLIGATDPAGRWSPFVGADEQRVRSQRPIAQEIADKLGQPITLVRFELRTELDVVKPQAIALLLGKRHDTQSHR